MSKDLTTENSFNDFKLAYEAKRKLLDREREDFLFALGEQWSDGDKEKLDKAGIKPVTDNRIAPNLFLLTGLERQNRAEFKAFPEGEEDGLKAEIASALFKDSVKKSNYLFKASDQFKDGIICGESHLELYLDYSESLINAKPKFKKVDGSCLFPDPGCREYDFSDARYVFKLTTDVAKEDLIGLFPEKRELIEAANGGKIGLDSLGGEEKHIQRKDYPKHGDSSPKVEDQSFDLLERYYKKWVDHVFIADKKTGQIQEASGQESADRFLSDYKAGIESDRQAYAMALQQSQEAALQGLPVQEVPPPVEQDPERFKIFNRLVPEIWYFAQVHGISEPLCDEKAAFYPKWKSYPFIPFYARFSTAPLTGDDRHLLIQGLVHGVKGAQEKHNKAETLMLRHLNTSTNSGWLAEEDSWVDAKLVKDFGSSPGINLEYKQGKPTPQRIQPNPLSQGHYQMSVDFAESIKAQLGINSDLLAAQDASSGDSGRAIALRQKQGLLMVQELFDNYARSRTIAGRMMLSQLGEIYDTDSAMRVLGDAFMKKNFPPLQLLNEQTGQPEPMKDEIGQPMSYDKEMATLAIAEVLGGKLEEYDVSVGEAVASESQKIANSLEVKSLAQTYPGLVPPDILIRYSQLPESAKNELLSAIERAQASAAQVKPPMPAPTREGI